MKSYEETKSSKLDSGTFSWFDFIYQLKWCVNLLHISTSAHHAYPAWIFFYGSFNSTPLQQYRKCLIFPYIFHNLVALLQPKKQHAKCPSTTSFWSIVAHYGLANNCINPLISSNTVQYRLHKFNPPSPN